VIMFGAGTLSGLLGWHGAVRCWRWIEIMRIPFRCRRRRATSHGVTAAFGGARIYLKRGYIVRTRCPVMLGVLLGSLMGAGLPTWGRVAVLRTVFAIVILSLD
jgi:hypothetical protein